MVTRQKISLIFFSVIAIWIMILSGVSPAMAWAQGGERFKRQVNAKSGRVSFISPRGERRLFASVLIVYLFPSYDKITF